MRTAIVCGGAPMGGKEMMALELGEGLASKACAVEFVTSRWSNGEFESRLQTLDLPASSVWFGFISATLRLDCLRMTAHQLSRWPHLLLGYRRFLRRVNPEKVIHTNWQSLLLILPFLKPERDIFWLHDVIPDKPQYRRVFNLFSKRLGLFVPVSNAVAESLLRIGISRDKIRVIHNGIVGPASAQICERRRSKNLCIGIVGRVGEWKGHSDLVEAFSQIVPRQPTAELHIFGPGSSEYVIKLKQRAEQLGIASRLFWHGFVSDKARIYSEIDVCVVPSRCADSLPTVAIEAAFFGLPVVATRRGGLPEIIDDGVTGYLVEAERPQELAQRLGELLQCVELREKMGAAAHLRARQHFSRERFVGEFLRVLGAGEKLS